MDPSLFNPSRTPEVSKSGSCMKRLGSTSSAALRAPVQREFQPSVVSNIVTWSRFEVYDTIAPLSTVLRFEVYDVIAIFGILDHKTGSYN